MCCGDELQPPWRWQTKMPEENLTGVPGRCDLDEVSAWQYHLPRELIAARPTERRDDARLMVLRRQDHSISHRTIRDLPNLLQAGDRLVLNDTRVLPARLFGTRTRTGGRWEGLFLDQPAEARWRIAGQTRGRPAEGESITLHPPEATKPNLQLYLERQLADNT